MPWQETPSGNQVLYSEDKTFFISYQVDKNMPVRFFASDSEQGCETAVVIVNGGSNKISGSSYLILNGDWRKAYEKLIIRGLPACKKFYESKKKKYGSSWSQE